MRVGTTPLAIGEARAGCSAPPPAPQGEWRSIPHPAKIESFAAGDAQGEYRPPLFPARTRSRRWRRVPRSSLFIFMPSSALADPPACARSRPPLRRTRGTSPPRDSPRAERLSSRNVAPRIDRIDNLGSFRFSYSVGAASRAHRRLRSQGRPPSRPPRESRGDYGWTKPRENFLRNAARAGCAKEKFGPAPTTLFARHDHAKLLDARGGGTSVKRPRTRALRDARPA